MKHIVTIENEISSAIPEQRLRDAAHATISAHRDAAHAMTIVLTTNDAVQTLNQQFRGIDAPTDVLSFPAEALPPELLGDEPPYLGDLVIAHPYASAQAMQLGHDPIDSFALLVVHGTLHLLGYDHDTPQTRERMWAEQASILDQLGIDRNLVPAMEDNDHD